MLKAKHLQMHLQFCRKRYNFSQDSGSCSVLCDLLVSMVSNFFFVSLFDVYLKTYFQECPGQDKKQNCELQLDNVRQTKLL